MARPRARAVSRVPRGVSLIELMVALVIGMVLMAGALAVFIDSRQTARVNQTVARIQENGLFAADEITRSLELAGYWGENNRTALVVGRTERTDGAVTKPSPLPAASNDCTDGYAWYTDLERPIDGLDTDGSSDANGAGAYDRCVPDTTYLQAADNPAFGASDLLVVRYADPSPITALDADSVYVRSNPRRSQLFVGTAEPTGFDPVTANNYPLRAYVYYVSKFFETEGDEIPTLKRVTLASGPSAAEEAVIPGVESFHVQFGIDTTRDGSANRYLNAGSVAAAQWKNVVAVRFWIVVRAEAAEPHFTDTATYRLPQRDVVAPGDGFRRVRITRTVQVRNIERS